MDFTIGATSAPETILNKIELKPNEEGFIYYSRYTCPHSCGGLSLPDTEGCALLVVDQDGGGGENFNIVLESVSLNPKVIQVGETTVLTIYFRNTGIDYAPAGMVLQVFVNGTFLMESSPAPGIPPNIQGTGSTTLIATSVGQSTICARIKAGYYNTPPQEKCDTITVGEVSDDFNIVLTDVTISPNQIDAGEYTKMTINMVNSGSGTAPGGLILQIKRNGSIVGESNPCAPIPAGHGVIGEMNFTETVVGTHTFCARIKEGYYDTLPQEKCANLSVGGFTGGIINIYSEPSGADIYMDTEFYGITPFSIEDVTPGQHAIQLKKTGYVNYNTTVNVEAGIISTITATLTPSGGGGEEPTDINVGIVLGAAGLALLGGIMVASPKASPKK